MWYKKSQDTTGTFVSKENYLISSIRNFYMKDYYLHSTTDLDKITIETLKNLPENSLFKKSIVYRLKDMANPGWRSTTSGTIFTSIDIVTWLYKKGLTLNEIPYLFVFNAFVSSPVMLSVCLSEIGENKSSGCTMEDSVKVRKKVSNNRLDSYDNNKKYCFLLSEINKTDLAEKFFKNPPYSLLRYLEDAKKMANCKMLDVKDDVIEDFIEFSPHFLYNIKTLSKLGYNISNIKPENMEIMLMNKNYSFEVTQKEYGTEDCKYLSDIADEANPLGQTNALVLAGYDVSKLSNNWYRHIYEGLEAAYTDAGCSDTFYKDECPLLLEDFIDGFGLTEDRVPPELLKAVKK